MLVVAVVVESLEVGGWKEEGGRWAGWGKHYIAGHTLRDWALNAWMVRSHVVDCEKRVLRVRRFGAVLEEGRRCWYWRVVGQDAQRTRRMGEGTAHFDLGST